MFAFSGCSSPNFQAAEGPVSLAIGEETLSNYSTIGSESYGAAEAARQLEHSLLFKRTWGWIPSTHMVAHSHLK